jgi:hypothetical protein
LPRQAVISLTSQLIAVRPVSGRVQAFDRLLLI